MKIFSITLLISIVSLFILIRWGGNPEHLSQCIEREKDLYGKTLALEICKEDEQKKQVLERCALIFNSFFKTGISGDINVNEPSKMDIEQTQQCVKELIHASFECTGLVSFHYPGTRHALYLVCDPIEAIVINRYS